LAVHSGAAAFTSTLRFLEWKHRKHQRLER
jgi:hypothetical protein